MPVSLFVRLRARWLFCVRMRVLVFEELSVKSAQDKLEMFNIEI